MKKLLAMLLTGAMVFSVAACGSDVEPSKEASTPSESKKQESSADDSVKEEPEEIVSLKMYMLGNPVAESDFAPVMEKVNEITKEEIGAELDITIIDGGSMKEKMNVIMASGEVFDIMWVGYCNPYDAAVTNGALVDLTDMIASSEAVKSAVPDTVLQYLYRDDKVYSVPCMQTMTTVQAVHMRKDLVDKYNFDYKSCETLADFAPFFEQIAKNEEGVFPFETNDSWLMWKEFVDNYWWWNYGLVLKQDGSNKIYSMFDVPEFKQYAELLHEFYEAGYIREDVLTFERGNKNADIKAGKYAAWTNGSKPGIEVENFNSYGFETYVKEIVAPTVNSPGSTTLGISTTSEHPEKAFQVIELLCTSSEIMNLLCYGVEGIHYTLNDAGKIVLDPNAKYSQAGFTWAYGNQFLLTLTENQPDGLWETTIEKNNTSELPYGFGLSIPQDVKEAIETDVSLYQAIYNEYWYTIVNGAKDPDEYWDELKERTAEYQNAIIEKLQPVVDEWIAEYK